MNWRQSENSVEHFRALVFKQEQRKPGGKTWFRRTNSVSEKDAIPFTM
jgi:hypothetical protein